MCCLVYAGLEGTGAENNVSIFIRLRSAYYVHAFVFILFRQNQRKKPIPADIGRCGICLVFRVLPGTWRVNAFSPKFLTHLFGMLPDEREPHNLPWQCLGLGCCYFKTKLCSFQLNRIYTAGLFWWLPSQRQYLYIYIYWLNWQILYLSIQKIYLQLPQCCLPSTPLCHKGSYSWWGRYAGFLIHTVPQ